MRRPVAEKIGRVLPDLSGRCSARVGHGLHPALTATHPHTRWTVDTIVVLLLCYPDRLIENSPLQVDSFIEDVVLVLAEGETVEAGRSGL